jgi:hypothetical protein
MCQARRFERGPEIRIGLFPFWGVEGRRLAGRPGTWILPAISFVFFILDANNKNQMAVVTEGKYIFSANLTTVTASNSLRGLILRYQEDSLIRTTRAARDGP